MSKKGLSFLILYLLILLLNASVIPVFAEDEEALGNQAEQAGKLREALTHYTAALQTFAEGSDKEEQLREKIIALAQKIVPPAAAPDEAIDYEGRAEAAIKRAETPQDYLDAAEEYRKALQCAPWEASYYYNLGLVLEKAQRPAQAIRYLKLYLLAAPAAPDAKEVRKKIAGLGYEMEKGVREKEAREGFMASLAGTWIKSSDKTNRYTIKVSGNTIEIAETDVYFNGGWQPLGSQNTWQGTVEGTAIKGTWDRDFRSWLSNGFQASRPMTGTISEDGKRIHLEYKIINQTGIEGNMATGWAELECELDLERTE